MQCFYHPQRVLVTNMLVAKVKAGESLLHLRFSVHALPYERYIFDLYMYTPMRQIACEIAMLFYDRIISVISVISPNSANRCMMVNCPSYGWEHVKQGKNNNDDKVPNFVK